ncbi:hypothetical protein QFC21_007130 [Naganishia friedmannii]|uniref:Uncharacterized protein n=1 Tax=Naganishia friedmannii TaxID=89922 RepID=A0ACC2UXM9_9TREE|nr:hypothetical protein QFC21_007130 [Naganishia friedmannii]
MADYFDAKVDLQAYVFDEHTPEAELILDILDGLPDYMLPTLKSSITPDMDLLDFRRILLDYKKGLRWNGPWNSRKQDNAYTPRQNNTPGDRPKNSNVTKDKDGSKPPRPCSCGGVHWYRDCPKKASKSNNVSSYRSNPNKIPVSGSKWPTYGKTGEARKKEGTEAHMNFVRIEPEEEEPEQVIELSLPEQDNEGFDELYQSVCNNNSTPNNDPLQYRHTDKVPTFALAKIGNKNGTSHEVCIDTGSAISLIDSSYLRRHFPSIKVQSASTIMLKGVGNNQTHGWIHADIHFINLNKGLTSVKGAFHVVTSLATKIIIGNDILAEEGVVINMKEGTCSFYSGKDIVSITSVRPKPTTFIQPSARLQKVFTIKPGFQQESLYLVT